MKTQLDSIMSKLPKKFFRVMAVLVTLSIVIGSAFHASHVMVFFSLIILSVLFLSMYAESEHHKLFQYEVLLMNYEYDRLIIFCRPIVNIS